MSNTGKVNALTIPVGIAVVSVWAFSAFAGFLTSNYTPLTITTPVMVILAGYAFGLNVTRGRNENGK